MAVEKTEKALEAAIEDHLIQHDGYRKGSDTEFEADLALEPKTVISFIKKSQSNEWEKLKGYFGSDIQSKVINRLVQVLNRDGMLKVLRRGFDVYDVRIKMAFFKPASGLNPEIIRQYEQNIMKVTRQVHYSMKNKNSIDMLLSLNGLPIVTVELKNQFTSQTVKNAIRQYKQDRDPKELLFQFKKRALVHFAVDPDEAYMTTELKGNRTFFLPFNKGTDNGAGNPVDYRSGFRTSYLWENIWQKDSLLDIIHRFLHLQVEEKFVGSKTITSEKMIFPRYHQLDAVRKIEQDAKVGAGRNYLIQHSAGSGKSNSIAWIAHRLSNLHDEKDELIFTSVIVITDRIVLDRQLQDTIYQFEHAHGVVKKIEKDSRQLGEAIKSGAKIIISTIQKFPYIIDQVEEQSGRNFAVIIDEAHSSQTGKSASALKEVLSAKSLEEATKLQEQLDHAKDDAEEEILKELSSRGPQENLSFFAFTATPKAKTLEMFGRTGDDGKPHPFHLYSMRQAIEEGFILDVLKNYMTYKTYFKLAKVIQEDPTVDKKKANRAIARFVSLHPHNLAQKTEVMIEHFRRVTMHKIGGRAKAMVVTSSRLHAYRYQREFQRYIKNKGYTDIRTLVAFSGSILDDEVNQEYTESQMNGFGEGELPQKFATNEYKVLIVADKYQTGFDEPLLHTMFVDKKLSGIQAVQTLSRLNRTHPGKQDTFVLDFVNEAADIQKAFLPFYEKTVIQEGTDFNLMFDLKSKLDDAQIYWGSEVEGFCKVFFKPKTKQNKEDVGQLHRFVDPAVDRYKERSDEEQDEFKTSLTQFVRLYSFVSQIAPFQSVELHKLHAYGQLLLKKLPKSDDSGGISLDDEVELEYYRLEEVSKGSISLVNEEQLPLKGTTEAGTGARAKGEEVQLSSIIDVLNERFGTEFKQQDKLFFDQIMEDLVDNEEVAQSAQNNTMENFKYAFEDSFMTALIDRMGQNQDIFTKVMNDEEFQGTVKAWMLKVVYDQLQE